MMPLTLAGVGEKGVIVHVGGSEETRRFLGSLGIVVGTEITIISAIGGNVIVSVKDSRIAINEDIARYILV